MWRIARIPGITFGLFLVWKLVLLVTTSQPIPFCDAFFYDGPVVNFLLHGKYCNPSLAAALPISGTELYATYPPLHQLALLIWMSVFGTSALSAMWYQFLLLVGFTVVTYSTLKMLLASRAALNWAGLFCFGITFHERADLLAYLMGGLAIWSCVRARCNAAPRWFWAAAGFAVLSLCSSLQIGGIHLVLLALLLVGDAVLTRRKIPLLPCFASVGVIVALIAFAVVCCPRFWAGFQEHLKATPTVTGVRTPRIFDALKIGRALAGVWVVTAALAWLALTGKLRQALRESYPALLTICAVLTLIMLAGSCLILFFSDMIRMAVYMQPLVVGAFFIACGNAAFPVWPRRALTTLFAVAVLVGSLRAIGMSTVGVQCARDVSRTKATTMIRQELDSTVTGSTVLFSSAYLYDAAQRTNINWIHFGWTLPLGKSEGIAQLRPGKIVLTQFDYYWTFVPMMQELRRRPNPPEFKVRNTTGVVTPDANSKPSNPMKHLAWAPVFVDCTWPGEGKAQ